MSKNILVLFASVVLSLLLLEGLSRIALPIQYGNKSFQTDGHHPVSIFTPHYELKPDIEYRQITQEFDVPTRHSTIGTRGAEIPDEPEILFIGDSMTYGVGLSGEQTIPYLVCKKLRKRCVNLGLPGSSTITQLDRLEDFLKTQGWSPQRVILMPNVMTSSFMGGNDLADNVRDLAVQSKPESTASDAAPSQPSLTKQILEKRYWILEHVNLVRLTYYIFGPMLREALAPGLKDDERTKALNIMRSQFGRFYKISQTYRFDTAVFLVHPMQDVMRGSWRQTEQDLQEISAYSKVTSTAPALTGYNDISDVYYPLDGHVTPVGARAIADFIAHDLSTNQPSQ